MAHELDINNGIASFADSRMAADGRVDAWHKLGQTLGRNMTAAEALEAAQLANWNVRKQPAWTTDENGLMIPMDDRFATVRTNPQTGSTEYLGDVGSRYEVIQNEQLTDFMDALVDESGAHYETAGALRGGRQVFITMKIPAYMTYTGTNGVEDRTDLYIAVMNSHDGFGSLGIYVTPVRVLCANTQSIAIASAKNRWMRRHTGKALTVVEEAREALGIAMAYGDAFGEEMDKLIQREVDEADAERLINSIFQVDESGITERQRNGRQEHATSALLGLSLSTVEGFENSRYGLLNAVTEYVDHRIETKDGRGVSATNQLFDGSYLELKQRAYAVLAKA